MNSKLDVTLAAVMDSGTITITPAGELTLRKVHGRLPVARRAASLAPARDLLQGTQRVAPPQGAAA